MKKGHPYNGWNQLVRYGRDKHYYHAQKRMILPQERICRCCKQELPDGVIPYHSEDYGPTLEDYWRCCVQLCHRCHGMVHARFRTPNRWKRLLTQIVAGDIDKEEFPVGKNIAGMLSKFNNREDTADYVPMPEAIDGHFSNMLLTEYEGPLKAATLLVRDIETDVVTEVPDWTLYGDELDNLSVDERDHLNRRGIDIDQFLSGGVNLSFDKNGRRKYIRLYL